MSNASLSSSNLLMLGSDDLNVNKAVPKKMDQELLKSRKKGLIDIGICNIHTIHDAFRKNMKELGGMLQICCTFCTIFSPAGLEDGKILYCEDVLC